MVYNKLMGDVLPFEQPPRVRQHLLAEAAHWATVAEDAYRVVEMAERNREDCLRKLGMLGIERGVPRASKWRS